MDDGGARILLPTWGAKAPFRRSGSVAAMCGGTAKRPHMGATARGPRAGVAGAYSLRLRVRGRPLAGAFKGAARRTPARAREGPTGRLGVEPRERSPWGPLARRPMRPATGVARPRAPGRAATQRRRPAPTAHRNSALPLALTPRLRAPRRPPAAGADTTVSPACGQSGPGVRWPRAHFLFFPYKSVPAEWFWWHRAPGGGATRDGTALDL